MELKELDLPEIRQRLVEAEEELANLRFQLASHQLDNTAKVQIARRDVARLKTVLHARETEAATSGVKEA
jgi:large subunit ribosomal protein L29